METNPRRICEELGATLPRKRPRWIRTTDLVRDATLLSSRIPHDVVGVIGVARSGMLPASVIATLHHLPLWSLDQESGELVHAGHGWRLRGSDRPLGKMLLVDDSTGSGRSLRMSREALADRGITDYLTAVIYRNPESAERTDFHAVVLTLPHFLEWNFTNSIITTASAFDMDGIICHDGESGGEPGTPLYLPRREPVHIITGRREHGRKATLRWLERWGVEVASLTMKPMDDERSFAEYKAEAVAAFAAAAFTTHRPGGAPAFFESCPHQARQIASISGVMTVCPRTGEVHGPEGCWLV